MDTRLSNDATCRNRTYDARLFRPALYRLS